MMKILLLSTKVWCVLILTFISTALFAQNSKISGKITDAKNAGLPNVSVLIKGTTTGTVADVNGSYTLAVPNNEATQRRFKQIYQSIMC